MSVAAAKTRSQRLPLSAALEQIAAHARDLDAEPRFPRENMESLRAAGVLQLAVDRQRSGLVEEISLVRAVAAVDASTARILDGHLNGVERLAMGAPESLCKREHQQMRYGELLVGVWGADPARGEGLPARIERSTSGEQVLRGVKIFCSGAGGVQRALVVASDIDGRRRLVYVDTSQAIQIDRDWFRPSGLRASESHRVQFQDTPVLAVVGGENELAREPYFSRDGVRTSATWAGLADCILRTSIDVLRDTPEDELKLHTLGRMWVAHSTIDRWLSHTGTQLDLAGREDALQGPHPDPSMADLCLLALRCRVAIAACARMIATQAAQVCGSRILASGGTLDRARRDLDLFLLQHRLDPKLVALGRSVLDEASK